MFFLGMGRKLEYVIFMASMDVVFSDWNRDFGDFSY
jgi:hypothetical protein